MALSSSFQEAFLEEPGIRDDLPELVVPPHKKKKDKNKKKRSHSD